MNVTGDLRNQVLAGQTFFYHDIQEADETDSSEIRAPVVAH